MRGIGSRAAVTQPGQSNYQPIYLNYEEKPKFSNRFRSAWAERLRVSAEGGTDQHRKRIKVNQKSV